MKIFKNSLLTFLLLSASTQAGLFDAFTTKKANPEIIAKVSHYFDTDRASVLNRSKAESDRVSEFISELHEEYRLFVAKYDGQRGTYVGEHNKDDKHRFSKVTAYSDLTFRPHQDGYQMVYKQYRGQGTVVFDLGTKYNDRIEELFSTLQNTSVSVKLEEGPSFGRGGTTLRAKGIPTLKSLTVRCTKEVYSDGSGGNSCGLSSKVDLSGDQTEVVVDGARGTTVVPKKYIKNWADAYYNNKF